MYLKKVFTMGAVAALSVSCFALPAFAHGHHRQQVQVQTQVSCPAVCTVENCAETGRHTHNGVEYCGYQHSSGYCDGSCTTVNTNTNYGGHHGHHGCH